VLEYCTTSTGISLQAVVLICHWADGSLRTLSCHLTVHISRSVGLQAVLLSERLSGKGIVTALNMATGVPVWEIEPALGLLVGALMAGGIYPIVRRLGARADAAREASNSNTPPPAVPARKWGDSFQVPPPPLTPLSIPFTPSSNPQPFGLQDGT